MDDVSWGALAAALTVLGGLYTWYAFRRRGTAAGLRGAGLTVVPAALWLTGTLELLGEVGSAVGSWAGDFVLDPAAWVGIVLAGVAVVCWVVSGLLAARGGGEPAARAPERGALPKGRVPKAGPAVSSGSSGSSGDPEMDEIEALLRKRGIQ